MDINKKDTKQSTKVNNKSGQNDLWDIKVVSNKLKSVMAGSKSAGSQGCH
jgi:hypothetical protein